MRKRALWILVLLLALAGLAGMVLTGALRLNRFAAEKYAVHGVDVSHYQGEIDFDRLAEQGMQFAFIKATEGSSFVDERFGENLEAVRASELRAGFYHFFSYDSPGASQAAHFIGQVPRLEGMLPPVIDVEFYGKYFSRPAEAAQVLPELRTMVDALEAHYGMKPVIYCTQRAYRLYVREAFEDCGLWIRDVYLVPKLDREWTFWQYTDRARLEGYAGDEPCIDVNVFAGTAEQFRVYPEKTTGSVDF